MLECLMPELWNQNNAGQSRNPAPHRLALESVIGIAAGVSALYLLTILVAMPVPVIFALSLSSMIAIVWMTIKILKDPFSTEKTFDDYLYMDREDLRPTKVEEPELPD